jgi:hypothetical protein
MIQITETDIGDKVVVEMLDALAAPHPFPDHEREVLIPEISEQTRTLLGEILDIPMFFGTEMKKGFSVFLWDDQQVMFVIWGQCIGDIGRFVLEKPPVLRGTERARANRERIDIVRILHKKIEREFREMVGFFKFLYQKALQRARK